MLLLCIVDYSEIRRLKYMVYKFILYVDAPGRPGFYSEDFHIDMKEMVEEGVLSKRYNASSLKFRVERDE